MTTRLSIDLHARRWSILAAAFLALVAAPGIPAADNEAPRAPGEWARRAPLPEQRTEVSVATDGELIYLLGGFGREGERQASAPRTVYAYDPDADAWSAIGELPEGVNHAGLVALDGELYVVGGYRENSFEPTAAVRIYDPGTGAWRDGAPLPTARGALAVAVLDGRIHAIGGTVDGRRSVGTHEVYDPAADGWSARAPMPTARNHHGAAVVDGRIHVPAGRVDDEFRLTVHEVYDPGTDGWSEAAPVPTGRSGIAVVALDGRVYVFGGETFGGERRTFDEAERYDPATDGWAALPPMPTARHGLGAAVVGGSIYVIAGGPEPGFAFSDANERLTPGDAP